MNLFADIRALVIDSLDAMAANGDLPAGLDFANVSVEPPRDSSHGDMATNAAMVLAKPAGMKPRDIADNLAEYLRNDDRITSVEVAGPGFLNLRLVADVWQGVVRSVLEAGTDFGRSRLGAGKKMNVEFVSANPTGPLHVGHTRGAVFGDALAALLDFAGHDVTREYYINDGGAQVDVLARSVFERYREACGLSPEIAEGLYPGDYLVPVGEELKAKYGDSLIDAPEEQWLADVRVFSTNKMMELIRDDLAALGVEMDQFYSEKSLYGTGRIEAAIDALDAKGLIYEGKLDPPKGKLPDDWEAREQTLFRSTEHGDDVDRPVKKSDGSWTYFAPDIAYHYDKLDRGFDHLIDVFGADHGGYEKRLKAVVSALSDGEVDLDVKLTQLVRLYKDGAPFKMSKRAGTFVTLRDVVDLVGSDVVRFVMLTRKNDAPLDFDFDKVLDQSKDNPVFYVQYAHARVCSVLRRTNEMFGSNSKSEIAKGPSENTLKPLRESEFRNLTQSMRNPPRGLAGSVMNYSVNDELDVFAKIGEILPSLEDEAEFAVAKKLAEWPRLVEIAAKGYEPHRIAFYLYDLASEFHALWNRGNAKPELRFLQDDDPAASAAKIALPRAVAVVISAGLGILGVTPATEMR